MFDTSMIDKLETLQIRMEEILNALNDPAVAGDSTRFQQLMRDQAELQPIVDAFKEYKKCQETIDDSLMMLEEEKDEDMREMLKEELNDAKKADY